MANVDFEGRVRDEIRTEIWESLKDHSLGEGGGGKEEEEGGIT